MSSDPDADLLSMDRDTLLSVARTMRVAIRDHRDSTRHELCWHHPALWHLLPDRVDPQIEVPEWPQFLRGCLAYRQSLDVQRADAPRTSAEFKPQDRKATS